ncbi:MAG: hypothetical protein CVV32_01265 [Methanomicrobiales archaeon HGW-Methanomicrobiales-3]|nr:MAG: hypothetical protein CVV32_01265 [Methanomicrobiales archaeon HGW-Methanomicrobiales-3]
MLLFVSTSTLALPAGTDAIEPVMYLNCNEGSGLVAFDASGHGSAGTLSNVSRVENGVCGGALIFDRPINFVSIPYRSTNHPDNGVSVSAWFFVDSFGRQDLVSTCQNGGYCLGFGDGNDLWWTVHVPNEGEVSVNVQHEGITPWRWHHVAGVYDGKSSKIYLDGVLRNQVNATGPVVYEAPNYVMLGAHAGDYDTPDSACPNYLYGGLDEIRIYDQGIPYSQIIDDRFRCTQESSAPPENIRLAKPLETSCNAPSGHLALGPGESVIRTLEFDDAEMTATWDVRMEPNSTLVVNTYDHNQQMNPDAWNVEIRDATGRIDRSIAFPNTSNAPVDGVITSGNATVAISYFDGTGRFPATVSVRFTAIAPPPPPPLPTEPFLNPIIVIYSASWATLIALILVIFWLHQRRVKRREMQAAETAAETAETKRD